MIDAEFIAYRAVATPIENEYYEFIARNEILENKIDYLIDKERGNSEVYYRVCVLRLLCQEIALIESMHGVGAAKCGSAADRYDELYRLAYFDPLSINDCASYYFYDVKDIKKAKRIALYATFIAEHSRAYVRHSHQLLLRIAHAERDLCTAEVAIRRIVEYIPDDQSPDPAIESDVITMVGELTLEPTLKAAFFNAVSDQNP